MFALIIGIVVFLGVHSIPTRRDWRAKRVGSVYEVSIYIKVGTRLRIFILAAPEACRMCFQITCRAALCCRAWSDTSETRLP